MTTIIDVSHNCGNRANALASAGVTTIFRYYSRDTLLPSKQMRPEEARLLSSAGIHLAIVYEGRFGDKPDNFDRASGIADARYARAYGALSIGQPTGSTIYFAVDFDVVPDVLSKSIIPYFQGIADAFNQSTGEPDYVVGVYGSGAVCQAMLSAGLAQRAWLAQSTGWTGYTHFLESKRWTIRQEKSTQIAGITCDSNVQNPDLPPEGFILSQKTSLNAQGASTMYVNARSGLRLRSGPGTEFESVRLLAYGFTVHPLKTVGIWTCIDLQGDGMADGFVSSAFLTDRLVASLPSTDSITATSGDAIHVRELIKQGESAEGLAAARAAASASLKGYPKNGCAAHLSALLQLTGIDVPMTWGAGKLAHLLESRNWQRILVGSQQPGDVGVCLDNTSPPGADHVYLVISVLGSGQMMVADNQNSIDSPHSRYQSGHGKTDTEYFLRAA